MRNEQSFRSVVEFINKHIQSTPFYKDYKSISNYNDFLSLPFINKDILKKYIDRFSNTHKSNLDRDKLIIKHTSGSSGKCAEILWNKLDDNRCHLNVVLERYKEYKIKPTDRFCTFYSVDYINGRLINNSDIHANDYRRAYSKINLAFEDICNNLIEFNPKWLLIQPSYAMLLCNYLRKNNFTLPNLQYVETTGELLLNHERNYIEDTLNCKVCNMYSMTEFNCIAYECNYQTMHIMNSNVYVEIIKDGKPVQDGEEGEICVTTLQNSQMPLIRYMTGDRGIIHNTKCTCGKELSLEVLAGRKYDFLNYNSTTITPEVFLEPIYYINDKYSNIINQFRYIKENSEGIKLELVLKDSYRGWGESIANIIEKRLHNIIDYPIKLSVDIKDTIPIDPLTNKFSHFIFRE